MLERPCPECGFDASIFPCQSVPDELETRAAAWRPLLAREHAPVRPAPTTWSTLEYACHVRDVFRVFEDRLRRMLVEDNPLFENWDQDATAVEARYGEQEPTIVADELEVAGNALVERFSDVGPDDWSRPGRRSDGSNFTVGTLSCYLLHDVVHHLHDVEVAVPPASGS